MKLKKIASLMLAGVMAVSMLTACGSNTINDGAEDDGNGEGTTTSGYSAKLESYLSDEVKDIENVTFQDNAANATALESAVKNISAKEVLKTAKENPVPTSISKWSGSDYQAMIAELKKAYDIQDDDLDENDMNLLWAVNEQWKANRNLNDAVVYAVTGSVDLEKSLKKVADSLNSYFEALPAKGEVKTAQTNNPALVYDYDYTISVSVVNKPVTVFTEYDGSVNYIAVTVSRTIA